MMNTKTFLSLLMPLMVASTATAGSFSVKAWEEGLKNALNGSSAKLSAHLNFAKYSKEALARTNTPERKTMLEARQLFAAGKFDAALEKYNQIEKGSDYWLEAVEEKGWAYHRKGDFERSLAQTKTLLAQPLVQISGSEGFFLQSLSMLKICDYPGIFSTHQTFKDTQKARIASIETMAQRGTNSALPKVLDKIESFPLTFAQVGTEAKDLPHLFYRDLEVQKNLLDMKLSSRALALIQARIDSAPETRLSFANTLTGLKKTLSTSESKLKSRLQKLAKDEDKKNQLMLQKLGLIEVETIQRMHADRNVDTDTYKSGQFAQVSKDQLVFPDDGMPWMDELDKFEVMANTCPRNVRRKM